jgi:pyridoxal phosphate enzyme (YggS family)
MYLEDRLRENLESVDANIAASTVRSGRNRSDVLLVAVTKRRSLGHVRGLSHLGIRDFGENYPQELWDKVAGLSDLPTRWHLIGHLQSNKAARTAPMVRMIHGVDSLKLLRTLAALNLPNPPEICLQVNCSGETSKHGWSPADLLKDSEVIAACSDLPVVGLMTMAAYGTDSDTARPMFAQARELRDRFRESTGLALPHLSMGMSGDYEAAVKEGATLVRVGSALFEGVEP